MVAVCVCVPPNACTPAPLTAAAVSSGDGGSVLVDLQLLVHAPSGVVCNLAARVCPSTAIHGCRGTEVDQSGRQVVETASSASTNLE